ncbi:MAG: polyphosphate kinase [Thermoleophilaceae bacterium]|jgi:polyphosphate kinase|nr:polyphosphate kinase [Thermoleophilaceae bacterium]
MEPTQAAERDAEMRPSKGGPDLADPSLYDNRELSWLDFNDRVLQLAEDETTRLLERAKFLAIYQSNLDEYFMVRVAGLHDQVDARIDTPGSDGLTPTETVDRVAERVAELGERHSCQWTEAVLPELAEHGMRVITCEACEDHELEAVDRVFRDQIFPALTPLGVGPGRPFPYISNLSLSLAVWLRDPVTEVETFARVKVPKEVLPRFVPIGDGAYVPLENAIARHLDQLFPGMEVVSHDVFRVTRDADFTVSDEADDLLEAVENELRRRRFGEVVRLEVGATMDAELRERLVGWLQVEERQVYDVEGMLDLTDLWELYKVEGHSDLRDPPHSPVTPLAFQSEEGGRADIFAAMRQGDLLVHQPYESFSASVVRFVEQAVEDPDVLAIKLTVYRTDDESSLIPALIRAAERGKQAVCMLELKARFDERQNIGWARALEEAGAHVVHGVPGLKTHAKALLVVRREGDGVRNYVHVGTGNYNAKTARIYEDFGLFTTDRELTADVADLFNSLTGYARPREFRKALTSPQYLRDGIIGEIERTIAAHQSGEDARIVMKMNALVDARCIRALYRASQAGVTVDLNVRGICRLRPGIEGVSENIRVVSIVGRFLEHSRVYGFQRGDETRYLIGSADLMPRNLDSRVELVVPVEAPDLKAELEDTLERCFADDTFAWVLDSDGEWQRRTRGERSVHAELAERAQERAAGTPEA